MEKQDICSSECLCVPLCECLTEIWKYRETEISRLLLFFFLFDPAYPPAVKNHVFPLKTARLPQIKLNNVRAVNPCVFQQLKPPHPPLRMSASGPPLRWPCSQAARLPVPDRDNSRPPSDFLPRCDHAIVCPQISPSCSLQLHFFLNFGFVEQ